MKPRRGECGEGQGGRCTCKKAEAQFRLHRDLEKATLPLKIVLIFPPTWARTQTDEWYQHGAKRPLTGFTLRAAFGARGKAMASRCVRCGAPLNEGLAECGRCRAAFPAATSTLHKPVRRRLSIPLAAILAMGLLGALTFGGGRLAIAQTAPTNAAVTASVDGKPTSVGGPAIALLEQQFSGSKLHQVRSGKER